MTERPESPCIGVCTLDDHEVCVGCLRRVQEIAVWSRLSPAEQWAVVRDLPRRRAAALTDVPAEARAGERAEV